MDERQKQQKLQREVEIAEDRLENYYRAEYGPLWGEQQEQASAALRAELLAAYEAAGTPQDDRRIDV